MPHHAIRTPWCGAPYRVGPHTSAEGWGHLGSAFPRTAVWRAPATYEFGAHGPLSWDPSVYMVDDFAEGENPVLAKQKVPAAGHRCVEA